VFLFTVRLDNNEIKKKIYSVTGFVAADNKDTGALTELWLISEYHSNGSLYDFLQENTISFYELTMMVFNIINGLAHLHMEVIGTEGKPAMAHRDIKTKNILVKANSVLFKCFFVTTYFMLIHRNQTSNLLITK